jgi:endonuclease
MSSSAKRIEDNYGDLDEHYANGTLPELIEQLKYAKADEKAGKPNPTKMPISGNPYNVLNNFRSSLKYYGIFLDQGGAEAVAQEALIEQAAEIVKGNKENRQFELERNLQEALRSEISQLEAGLKVIDAGTEFSVESGQIDILAEDLEGRAVVIELKRGLAKREAIGQIAGYMGDLVNDEGFEKVRGILVAAEFDKSCRSAVRVIPNLELRTYRYSFKFETPDWNQ